MSHSKEDNLFGRIIPGISSIFNIPKRGDPVLNFLDNRTVPGTHDSPQTIDHDDK